MSTDLENFTKIMGSGDMDASNGERTVPRGLRWRRGAATVLLWTWPFVLGAEGLARSDLEASDRVRMTMKAATAEAPQMALQRAQLGAEVAGLRSDTGAGSPILTWQSEGIGGGFQRSPNAADYLRLSVPFTRPWKVGTIRNLQSASERWLDAGYRATTLEVASLAGRRWLDLAAMTAKVSLAEIRVARLNRSVLIQRKRFELGEISGSERRQVELQQAREAAILQQTGALRAALHQEIELLAPDGFPSPEAEDLAALVESTGSPEDLSAEQLLDRAPHLLAAETAAEVASLRAKQLRGSAWGQPEVEVEWERIPSLDFVEGFDSFGFRLAVPLPVGKRGRQQIRAAQQGAEAAEAERSLVRQRLLTRLEAARQTARGAEAALEALGPSIAEVEATGHSLSEQFRLGAISYLVYLDGFSRLDEVIQQAIEARYTLLVARLELASLMGTEVYFPLPELESEDES